MELFYSFSSNFKLKLFWGKKRRNKLENRKEENLSKISVQLYRTISSLENSIYLHPHREILYEGKDQIA